MKEKQAVLNFGKYKGLTVEEVISADHQYIEWLTSQQWFRDKFEQTYNVVINYFNPEKNECSPEHNRLQVLFLNEDIQRWFANIWVVGKEAEFYYSKYRHFGAEKELVKKITVLPEHIVISEMKYEVSGFDVVIIVKLDFSKDIEDSQWTSTNINAHRYSLLIEIKPTIGDEFPEVLRQIKRNKQRIRSESSRFTHCPLYILLTEKIQVSNITDDQVRKYFKNEGITLLTVDEIQGDLNV